MRPYDLMTACRVAAEEGDTQCIKISSFIFSDTSFMADFWTGLTGKNPDLFIRWLDVNGLIESYMEPLHKSKQCIEKYGLTTWDHQLATLKAVSELSKDLDLRMAALLHDVGKYMARKETAKGITFYNHHIAGADWVEQYLTNMGVAKITREKICTLIRGHMFRFDYPIKPATLRSWLLPLNESMVRNLFLLRIADRQGNASKRGRAPITLAMKDLFAAYQTLRSAPYPLFRGDIDLQDSDIEEAGFLCDVSRKRVWKEISGLLFDHPERNKRDILKSYLLKLPYRESVG
jgi:putative nucleotidyltransferase with HDIG domain